MMSTQSVYPKEIMDMPQTTHDEKAAKVRAMLKHEINELMDFDRHEKTDVEERQGRLYTITKMRETLREAGYHDYWIDDWRP